MSFSTQAKDKIIEHKIKNKCCKKAFMYGVAMASDINDGMLNLKFSHKPAADFTEDIARSIFKIKEIDRSSIERGIFSAHTLHLLLPTAIALAADIDAEKNTDEHFERIFACDGCISYFFSGLFCICGSISDPERSYTAELILPNKQRAEKINEIFLSYTDLRPRVCKRKNGYGVYFRNSESVGGFLSLFRINTLFFDFCETEFQNQERARVQRSTTFVTTNIQRAVSASNTQIRAIQNLIDSDRFYMLPEDLRLTAKLRLENPELSLKALASLHTPPITKSGLSHRLEKIMTISEDAAKK